MSRNISGCHKSEMDPEKNGTIQMQGQNMPYMLKKYISNFLSYNALFLYNDILNKENLSFVITLIIKNMLKYQKRLQ